MATLKRAVRRSASVVVGGALAVMAVALGGTVAQAAPAPARIGHWCPGDPWNPTWGNVADWDWNQCHDWQRPAGPTRLALGIRRVITRRASTSSILARCAPRQWCTPPPKVNMDAGPFRVMSSRSGSA